jgi:hypothetical protein
MKNVIFGAARYLPPPPDPTQVNGVMRLWSMYDNELINDVTEKFSVQPMYNTSVMNQVSNTKLLNEANRLVDPLQDQESYYIAPNTPFCVQMKGRFTSAPSNVTQGFRMGVWPENAAAGRCSWALQILDTLNVRFQISDNTGNTVATVSTLANAIPLNTDFHIAVERDATNKVTIYVDGVEKVSSTISIGGSRVVQRFTVQRGGVGAIWDMAISNEVVFGGPFTPPARFIKADYAPKYSTAIAADIVAQFAFRRDDPHNEVTGKPMTFASWAALEYGAITGRNNVADTYSADIDYFGAGDFTYEVKFRIPEGATIPATGAVLPSHWHNGAVANTNNRYLFLVQQNGSINVGFGVSAVATGSTNISSAAGVVTVGKDYHFVVERQGGVVKGYLNGVLILTLALATALWATTGNRLSNYYSGSTAFQAYVWDIRIAKRAMYSGNIVAPTVLPQMPVNYKAAIPNYSVRVGGRETVNGLMRGFAKNFLYSNTSLSFGELYPQVYWNSQQNRMVRIKAICTQGNGLIVLAHAPSNEPRQADTPVMTNNIKIGSETFNMVTGTAAGKANSNDTAVYYSSNLYLTWPTDEEMKTISFV